MTYDDDLNNGRGNPEYRLTYESPWTGATHTDYIRLRSLSQRIFALIFDGYIVTRIEGVQ